MTRTFTIKVTRRQARYTVDVRGTVPLEGERGRFRSSGRARLLKRAVLEAFTTLDLFAEVSPVTDERHEQQITASEAATTLRLEVTSGDETGHHYALRDRATGQAVFLNSATPIQFAAPRPPHNDCQ
jgi:hypothetical protein